MRFVWARVRTRPDRVRDASAESIGLRRAGYLAAALALAWPCVGAPAANAAGPQVTVTVHQASGAAASYFTLSGRPGRRARAGSLEVQNPTAKGLTVRLNPVNGLTAGTLGSLYATTAGAGSGSTPWITLGVRRLFVPAHSARSVEVAVLPPPSASSGDYLSGISVETPGSSQTTAPAHGLQIGESYRYVVGVETRLPGPRHPHIRFTGALVTRYPSSVVFLLLARNDGNVILKNVHGWVSITSGSKPVISESIPPGTFVSQTSIQLPVAAPRQHPTAGTAYRVRAELIYEGGVAYLDTGVTFGHRAAKIQAQYTPHARASSGTPWWALAVGALAALLLLLGSWWYWRRRRYPLSRRATLSLLRRRLALGAQNGAALSLVWLDLRAPPSRALKRSVVKVARPALRRSDAIGDLGGAQLLVILPDTRESLANGLAGELTAVLCAAGLGEVVGQARCHTPSAGVGLEQMLAEAAREGNDGQAASHLGATVSA